MGSDPPRLSSARRPRPPSRFGLGVILIVGAGLGLVALLAGPPSAPAPEATPRPEPSATAVPSPTPTTLPSPTPEPTVSTGWVEVPVRPPASPTAPPPLPTLPPPSPRPRPTATPTLDECLRYTASASQLSTTSGGILIEVDIENRCRRDLGPLDVWFEARGWRHGAVVQTARAHPFEALPRGGHAHLAFDLPGSITWYDKVDVRALP